MMAITATIFDTLAYAKKLKAAGFTDDQAEIQAQTLVEIIEERLATKQDLKELELSLKQDMKELELSLKQDIKELELRLKLDLTLRLGGMLVAGIAIVATLVKLL